MARYYRRRYTRTIARAPKKKWASCYKNISTDLEYGGSGDFYAYKELAENSTESTSPTPVIVKTGNFKMQFDMYLNVGAAGTVTARAYIFYVPEGYFSGTILSTTLSDIVTKHPEWIIAWRQLDFGNANASGSVDTSVVRMSSRLKRNLNSGDKIYFAVFGTGNFTGVASKGVLNGGCQFWTCAN